VYSLSCGKKEVTKMLVTKRNVVTGQIAVREMPVTQEELNRHRNGELAQNVWPNMDYREREFLISGLTPEEWDALFGAKGEM